MTVGHWDEIYATRAPSDLGWFEHEPSTLEEVSAAVAAGARSVIDIGAGASRLVDRLLDLGVADITLVDLSIEALEAVADRLAHRGARVEMISADVTEFDPDRTWSIWHDRATFHFLTEKLDRDAYRRALEESLEPGGRAVIAAFALDGPEMCAGLPVVRYDANSLAAEFSGLLQCTGCRSHVSAGLGADARPYVICSFRKPTDSESDKRQES
ncbi:MAG: class I SAM-dependent methyltransferase [Acidimicrobiia bacterium]|nr:class I SAM-dependent methyltransferase [Acidimicrobiia bacterium]